MTPKEKALKLIAKQIKELDQNDILLQEAGLRPQTQAVRLQLWDCLTINGYSLEAQTYKLIKK